MVVVPLNNLLDSLNSIPETHFGFETVVDCLKMSPVDERSLQPYMFFSREHYTRNLIFKNDHFELLASCWEIGQCSSIQSHPGRNCWITVVVGQLCLQLFSLREATPSADLTPLDKGRLFTLRTHAVAVVAADDPIHQLLNPPTFAARAVSLHLYSPPLGKESNCDYSENERRVSSIRYDSRYGTRDMMG